MNKVSFGMFKIEDGEGPSIFVDIENNDDSNGVRGDEEEIRDIIEIMEAENVMENIFMIESPSYQKKKDVKKFLISQGWVYNKTLSD